MEDRFGDVTVTLDDSFVATVEMHRPPENFFEVEVVRSLADAYEALDAEADCRAILLCAEGKHFCAGANLGGGARDTDPDATEGPDQMDREAMRLLGAGTPVVAAVQGAAIGAGFGLACLADFRVGCPATRFAANFARLGYHHILGLSITLPAIVGQQHALELLYTGRRLKGDEALAIGLCDHLVDDGAVRGAAHALAAEIAASAPLAVRSIRQTMRAGLADRFRAATEREAEVQEVLETTWDLTEGVRAARERRPPRFEAR
ncbi:MAG TPA: enoyl-CoA hydratase/isomerase family protein [Acidimicrobiales bacterium]|nr:enoyl-CoA hydratase/isomerase family protein [Acidimicrobiales bacterium]